MSHLSCNNDIIRKPRQLSGAIHPPQPKPLCTSISNLDANQRNKPELHFNLMICTRIYLG
ncbi:hypothetical protein BBBOND_0108870 [Babesia bigemina]|uniref:Uncharacterized protein n=1 Tax=Babesia bigemina TaxID=5866 RepID=A0A061D6L6_BABBI|nr:hypothetical protein BBBOND_0108870 [Babesia bigemina]CDR94589.1 hypothetical protein BBBOND_0108870 [Babesia bigemina]|eukprot:XP_012766775.1 hypothetical protein BBBOND_0108870 [Babesia bigemina]